MVSTDRVDTGRETGMFACFSRELGTQQGVAQFCFLIGTLCRYRGADQHVCKLHHLLTRPFRRHRCAEVGSFFGVVQQFCSVRGTKRILPISVRDPCGGREYRRRYGALTDLPKLFFQRLRVFFYHFLDTGSVYAVLNQALQGERATPDEWDQGRGRSLPGFSLRDPRRSRLPVREFPAFPTNDLAFYLNRFPD